MADPEKRPTPAEIEKLIEGGRVKDELKSLDDVAEYIKTHGKPPNEFE
jgi:hypothetical protein